MQNVSRYFIFIFLFSSFLISCSSFSPKDNSEKLASNTDGASLRNPAEQGEVPPVPMADQEVVNALALKNESFDYACTFNPNTNKDEVTLSFLNNRIYTNSTFQVGQRLKEAKESLSNPANDTRILSSGDYKFYKRYFGMYLINDQYRDPAYVYDLRNQIYEFCRGLKDGSNGNGMEYVTSNLKVLSLVGPFVSVQEAASGYSIGAAHPYASILWHSFDARQVRSTETPSAEQEKYGMKQKGNKNTRIVDNQADLLQMVTESSLLTALKTDPYLQKNIGKGKLAKANNIQEVVNLMRDNLDSCEVNVPQSVAEALSQFSVHDYRKEKDRLMIRLGFSYGCEAARGNFTELGLIVKPTDMFRGFLMQELESARQQNRRPYFGRYLQGF